MFYWAPFLRLCLGLAALALMSAPASARAGSALEISVTQTLAGEFLVTYALASPVRELPFVPVEGPLFERGWRAQDSLFEITRREGRDVVARRDGAKFRAVSILAAPVARRPLKDYRTVGRFGRGDLMFFTGHFVPETRQGHRPIATFDFTAAPGAQIHAFSASGPTVRNWRNPRGRPAFVYFGWSQPEDLGPLDAIVDPATPSWTVRALSNVSNDVFDFFERELGPAPAGRAVIYLERREAGETGRIGLAGDALPGQVHVTLRGGGWATASDRAQHILTRATIHELFHLWHFQSAGPADGMRDAWIHEGGAEAAAAETMTALGFWQSHHESAYNAANRKTCFDGLRRGSLASAPARGDFVAVYACGTLVMQAIAANNDETPIVFWRDFLRAGKTAQFYTTESFLDFVEARSGDKEFVRVLRDFVRRVHITPETALENLEKTARAHH